MSTSTVWPTTQRPMHLKPFFNQLATIKEEDTAAKWPTIQRTSRFSNPLETIPEYVPEYEPDTVDHFAECSDADSDWGDCEWEYDYDQMAYNDAHDEETDWSDCEWEPEIEDPYNFLEYYASF